MSAAPKSSFADSMRVHAKTAAPVAPSRPRADAPTAQPAATLRVAPIPQGAAQPSPAPQAPSAIVTYIDLEAEARAANSLDELRYVIANSTRKLAPYDQAFIFERTGTQKKWTITCASSVVNVDRDSETVRTLEAWANHPECAVRRGADSSSACHILSDAQAWELEEQVCAFPHGLWLEVMDRTTRVVAGFLVLKGEAWRTQHLTLLTSLTKAYGHAWTALNPGVESLAHKAWSWARTSKLGLIAVSVIAVAGMIPVPLTVLAPAEVVGTSPALVVAPIDGVIRDVLVAPGTYVEAGTKLVTFVDTKLRNDMEIASRAKMIAEAKYFKVLQSSVANQKDMQELAIAKAEYAMADAEYNYAREMMARSELKAPQSGVFIYSAKSDWVGKPVSTGERMMEIADPKSVELRVDLPISDSMVLTPGSEVKMFLDGEPTHAISATIERVSYRAVPTPDHQMVFRTFARFNQADALRIGLRGTARLHGEKVALGFYLFRRPIAALRQKVGL